MEMDQTQLKEMGIKKIGDRVRIGSQAKLFRNKEYRKSKRNSNRVSEHFGGTQLLNMANNLVRTRWPSLTAQPIPLRLPAPLDPFNQQEVHQQSPNPTKGCHDKSAELTGAMSQAFRLGSNLHVQDLPSLTKTTAVSALPRPATCIAPSTPPGRMIPTLASPLVPIHLQAAALGPLPLPLKRRKPPDLLTMCAQVPARILRPTVALCLPTRP